MKTVSPRSPMVLAAVRELGPARLTELVTRARRDLRKQSEPLVRRASALVLPPLEAAFHDGFRNVSELPSCLDLSFVSEIAVGRYPEDVKARAAAVVERVKEMTALVSGHGGRKDGQALYAEAVFAPATMLRALARLEDDAAEKVADMSVRTGRLYTEELKRTGLTQPFFPLLIWAGAIPEMNKRAAFSARGFRQRP